MEDFCGVALPIALLYWDWEGGEWGAETEEQFPLPEHWTIIYLLVFVDSFSIVRDTQINLLRSLIFCCLKISTSKILRCLL